VRSIFGRPYQLAPPDMTDVCHTLIEYSTCLMYAVPKLPGKDNSGTAQSWKSLLWPGCGNWQVAWTAHCSNIGGLVDHTSPAWALLDIRNNAITQMFEISKINSLLPHNFHGGGRKADLLWPMRSIKVCKEAIFRFAISSFKTQWDVRAQPPC